MKSLLEMKVRKGEPVKAEHWNALLDWLRATQVVGGSNVRVNRTPNGTYVTALPGALPVSGAFAVSLGTAETGQAATVSRGLVEGVEPTVGTPAKKIGGDAADPNAPLPGLKLPDPSKAEGYIYLRCDLSQESWRIAAAEVIFQAEAPAPKEWTAYKLLAILRKSGEAWEVAHQAVHFNLGHYAYGRKSSGKARHLFFAR